MSVIWYRFILVWKSKIEYKNRDADKSFYNDSIQRYFDSMSYHYDMCLN